MTEASEQTGAIRCPLCGEANGCAIAAGRDPESCWCMTATIDPGLLESVPAEARGKICVCPRCASKSAASD